MGFTFGGNKILACSVFVLPVRREVLKPHDIRLKIQLVLYPVNGGFIARVDYASKLHDFGSVIGDVWHAQAMWQVLS